MPRWGTDLVVQPYRSALARPVHQRPRRVHHAALVYEHIQTLLTDGRYRTNVERMRRCFQQYAQKRRAVEIVEKLLEKREERLVGVGPP